jgi:hypothetical protein
MIGHQLAELTGQQAVLAQRQPDLGLLFQRDQPLLLGLRQPARNGTPEPQVTPVAHDASPAC